MIYHVMIRVEFNVLGNLLYRQKDVIVRSDRRPTVRQIEGQIKGAIAELVAEAGYEGPRHSYEETSYEYVVQSIFRSP